MGLNDDIRRLQVITKARIQDALRNGKTEAIVSGAKDLEVLDRLEKRYRELEMAVAAFTQKEVVSTDQQNFSKSLREKEEVGSPPRESFVQNAREKGKAHRNRFVQSVKEKGIRLTHHRGPLFKDPTGGLIGIAYASERLPNRWWLGLPVESYKAIVLICENDCSEVVSFVFPFSFCQEHRDAFGTDKHAKQFKFNVSLADGLYLLSLPGRNPIVINNYMNKFDNIQQLS